MNFREFLLEGPQHAEWMLKEKWQIERLLMKGGFSDQNDHYYVDRYLEVRSKSGATNKLLITEELMIEQGGKYYFAFPIADVRNYLEIRVNGDIGSLVGLPSHFDQTIYLSAKSIVFDHLPIMSKGLALGYDEDHGMKSLTGIGKAKTKVDYITLGDSISECILGLAMFTYKDNVKPVKPSSTPNNELERACEILSEHILAANGSADMFDVKEALMEAGLKDYAKL